MGSLAPSPLAQIPGLGLLQLLGPLFGQLQPSPIVEVKVEETFFVAPGPRDTFLAEVSLEAPVGKSADVERNLRTLGVRVKSRWRVFSSLPSAFGPAGEKRKVTGPSPFPSTRPTEMVGMEAEMEGELGKLRGLLPKLISIVAKSGGTIRGFVMPKKPYIYTSSGVRLLPRSVKEAYAEAIKLAVKAAKARAEAASKALGMRLGGLFWLTLERVSFEGGRADRRLEKVEVAVKVSLVARFRAATVETFPMSAPASSPPPFGR